ncbi:hypothetical protein Tco_1425275 [Tanacetum coccineum]
MYVALTSLAKVISLMPAIVRVSLRELWCNADDHCFIPGMADDSIIQLAPVKSDKPKDIALGRHLEEIYVTWTQFGKKRDKIATLYEDDQEMAYSS